MFKLRNNQLLPDLYRGQTGTHLTAYLPDTEEFQEQIKLILWNAERLLKRDKGESFTKVFLEPIYRLANEPRLLEHTGSGGWALFRTESSFRLKRVPMKLPKLSVVANSFHVKPLLKWAQADRDCYVLSIDEGEARLYEAGLGRMRLIGTMPMIPEFFHNFGDDKMSKLQLKFAMIDWIDNWVLESLTDFNRPLILAGAEPIIGPYKVMSQYPKIMREYISGQQALKNIKTLRRALKKLLLRLARREMRQHLKDLEVSKRTGKLELDIERIAKHVVRGEVEKLFIAEDSYIWGVLNQNDGSLTVHPHQKNSRDDDLLDDLAELVLAQNSQVVLLPSHKLPFQSAIAAIVKGPRRPEKPERLSHDPITAA